MLQRKKVTNSSNRKERKKERKKETSQQNSFVSIVDLLFLYDISGTPTVLLFSNGVELGRLESLSDLRKTIRFLSGEFQIEEETDDNDVNVQEQQQQDDENVDSDNG
jgi:hypothetical protein